MVFGVTEIRVSWWFLLFIRVIEYECKFSFWYIEVVAFYVFGLVYLRRWLFEQQIELVLKRLQLQNKIVCPIYLLTGYPVRTEKYQARSHIVRTERSEVRATWLRA